MGRQSLRRELNQEHLLDLLEPEEIEVVHNDPDPVRGPLPGGGVAAGASCLHAELGAWAAVAAVAHPRLEHPPPFTIPLPTHTQKNTPRPDTPPAAAPPPKVLYCMYKVLDMDRMYFVQKANEWLRNCDFMFMEVGGRSKGGGGNALWGAQA
jgi:hypothetical protein